MRRDRIFAKILLAFSLLAFSGLIQWATPGVSQPGPEPGRTQRTAPGSPGEYLGEGPPGKTPKAFAPHIFIGDVHTVCQFSPDGTEVYWNMMRDKGMMFMKRVNGTWTRPARVPFFQTGDDAPTIAPDGRLFFVRQGGDSWDIYCVSRSDRGWSAPIALPDSINSIDLAWQASVAKSGNVYFGQVSRSTQDIYCSRWVDGQYAPATRLGDAINSNGENFCPFVAPDESYLIFTRTHGDSSYADLYVSFKDADGSWGQAVRLGAPINTDAHEMSPWVSFDGRYLFFISTRGGTFVPYWVDAGVIRDAKPQ
jgi:hypothetical protein